MANNARLIKIRDPATCCRALRAYCKFGQMIVIVDGNGNVNSFPYRHPWILSCGLDNQWYRYGSASIVWQIYCVTNGMVLTIT